MDPIKTPTSPLSPTTPTSAHPLHTTFTSSTPPQLRVNTNFALPPWRNPQRQLELHSDPAAYPKSAQGFKSNHRRHASSASTIVFPSPMEVILNQPLTALPTPPLSRFQDFSPLFSPSIGTDGRQSRMAMRSPTSDNHSPILGRVIALPLRLNTNSTQPRNPMQIDAVLTSTPISPASTITPSPRRTPHVRSPAISLPSDHFITSHTRSTSHSSTTTTSSKRSASTRSPITSPTHKRRRSPPPKYHLTTIPSLASILNNPNPQPTRLPTTLHPSYHHALTHLSTPLVPLISITTGLPHPSFPKSLLQYHLLTHTQLDSLARHYHQTYPPSEASFGYPGWVTPWTSATSPIARRTYSSEANTVEDSASLMTKRRRWGRFIGLRGCETPTTPEQDAQEGAEEMILRMEREWRRARERAEEERGVREKGWRGRW